MAGGRNGSARWADDGRSSSSPYAFNPFNVNPLRCHLAAAVDFERLRASERRQAVRRRHQCEDRAGRDVPPRRPDGRPRHGLGLPAAALPGGRDRRRGLLGRRLSPAIRRSGRSSTRRAAATSIIVQINPIERAEIAAHAGRHLEPAERDHLQCAACSAELRAADFVARLISSGVLEERGLQARTPAPHRRRRAARKPSTPRPSSTSPGPSSRNLRDLGRDGRQGLARAEFRRHRRREHARHRPRAPARSGEGAAEGRAGRCVERSGEIGRRPAFSMD